MTCFTYTVLLEPDPDDGGFTVTVPALPGCITQGDTVEEALEMAREAIGLYLHGEVPRPEPDGAKALVATVTVEVDVVEGLVKSSGVFEAPSASAVAD